MTWSNYLLISVPKVMLKLFELGMLTELFWKFPNHLNQANPQSHQSKILYHPSP